MEIRFKKEDIMCLLLIVPFLVTDYFMRFDIVADLIKLWKVFSGLYAVIGIISRRRVSYPFFAFSGMYFVMIVSGIYNGMFTLDPLISLAFLWIVDYLSGSRQMIERFLKTYITVGGILIIANFITMILFPGGFYSTDIYDLNWLLGYKNVMIRRMIPVFVCIFADAELRRQKLNAFEKSILISGSLSLLMSRSINSIVGLVMFVLLFISIRKNHFPKKLSLCKISAMYLCVCLIVLRMENLKGFFNYLFVELLDKNASIRARMAIWKISAELVLESPFIGFGNIKSTMYHMPFHISHPHNLLFYYLILAGIVGVGFWVAGIIMIDRKSRLISEKYGGQIERIFLASYIIYFVLGIFESLVGAIGFIPFMLLMYNIDRSMPAIVQINQVKESSK